MQASISGAQREALAKWRLLRGGGTRGQRRAAAGWMATGGQRSPSGYREQAAQAQPRRAGRWQDGKFTNRVAGTGAEKPVEQESDARRIEGEIDDADDEGEARDSHQAR